MFQRSKAQSVATYLTAVPRERQAAVRFLHKFIQAAAPKLKPYFAYNMLGYGSFLYRNYRNDVIRWPVVALANQKNYISVYVCAMSAGKYLAEKYKRQLGTVSVGKSCIRFRKLEDVNLPVLKNVIREAAKNPGLTVPEERL